MDYPKADRDSVNTLALEAKTDPSLIPRLWDHVQAFIQYQARRRRDQQDVAPLRGIELDDFVQEGYFALLDAVAGFDPEAGAGFAYYLSFHLLRAFRAVEGRETKRDALLYADSLDAPITEGEDDTRLEVVPDPIDPYSAAEERIFAEQLHRALTAALDGLPLVKRQIIKARYLEGRTAREIAQQRGVTQSSVQSQERAALRELRRQAWRYGLDEFVERNTPYFRHYGVDYQRRTNTSPVEAITLERERLRNQWKNETYFTADDGRKD